MKRVLAFSAAVLMTASFAHAQPGGQRPGGQRPGGGPGGGFRPPNPLLMIFDADQDGKLSKEEVAKASESLAKLDRNKNGIIEEDELPRPQRGGFGGPGGGRPGFGGGPGGQGGRGNPTDRFMAMDKNKDGKISKDELPERFPTQFFDRMDADKDGSITKEEIEKAMANFRRPGGGRPGGGRPGEGGEGGRRPRRPGGDGEEGGRRPRRPERPDA